MKFYGALALSLYKSNGELLYSIYSTLRNKQQYWLSLNSALRVIQPSTENLKSRLKKVIAMLMAEQNLSHTAELFRKHRQRKILMEKNKFMRKLVEMQIFK